MGNLNLNKPWELNNEDTKRKKFQVFENVSFDSRGIAVISGIALFGHDTKYKAVFTVLKVFYLVILTFKESLFLEIGNLANSGTLPRVREVFLNLAMYPAIAESILEFRVILNVVFWAVASLIVHWYRLKCYLF